jgi:hypothetical protein
MFKNTIILVCLLVFSGCASKSALSVFDGDKLYEKGLEYSMVGDIINSLETKAIINATYLNSTDSVKYNNEFHNFLVGIYITEDNKEPKDMFLNNKKYVLTLNDKEIEKVEELSTTNYLWEHIPIKNPYAKYYIVSFKKEKNKNSLNLKYENINLGKVILSFQGE